MLDVLYSGVARWRRRRAERRHDRHRLARPAISVGNLSLGGTGKTPVVAEIARWLLDRGERPAILSRGYARADAVPGVVVVSDGQGMTASLAQSGDEPLMLARRVPGAIVAVSPDRFLAGSLAERALGATVHVLDDGFQHLGLARDLDVLVTTAGEIPNGRVVPRGRLREPMDAASRAHVLVVTGSTAGAAAAEAWALGVSESCGSLRTLGEPYRVVASAASASRDAASSASRADTADGAANAPRGGGGDRLERGARVFAATGIANPQRFVEDLRSAEFLVAGDRAFPDHHRFSSRDLAEIARLAAAAGANAVVTTEKDAIRFEACGDLPFPLWAVPLDVRFDPPDVLFGSVEAALVRARSGRPSDPMHGGLR